MPVHFYVNRLNSDWQTPATNVLTEVRVFLEANPSEIITVIIEDYVRSPNGLTRAFNASGLMRFWFPVSRMPRNGQDWPTVDDMVQNNQRLVVFTSRASKESSERIAYQWRYMVENQCEPSQNKLRYISSSLLISYSL